MQTTELNSLFFTAVRSLNFQRDCRAGLRQIAESEWASLLNLTDRSQITLPLGVRCREFLPDTVRDRIDRNLADNRVRHQRLFDEYRLIASALQAASVDYIVLKGIAQLAPFYLTDPRQRPQYDIDIYCPSKFLKQARMALTDAGFAPVRSEQANTDHLPAMMRSQNWRWRNDYYDPQLPLTVEVHFRFWDQQTERLPATYTEYFWSRRTTYVIHGAEIPMLSLPDGVSYSSLHLIRHLLRGDLRTYHVYELAHFLHQTARNNELWNEWLDERSGSPPIIESVAFRLATDWFGCELHPIVDQAASSLPRKVEQWFDLFRYSPLAPEKPNKDELFLHMSLVDNASDRCSILLRRLLPVRPPKLIGPPSAEESRSVWDTCRRCLRQMIFLVRRAHYHIEASIALIHSLFRWKVLKGKYAAS